MNDIYAITSDAPTIVIIIFAIYLLVVLLVPIAVIMMEFRLAKTNKLLKQILEKDLDT